MMTRRRTMWATVVLAAAGLAPGGRAAEAEERTFSVAVDGKPAGATTMTYRAADDGAETLDVAADIRVRVLVVTYRYSLRSSEAWKAGKITGITANGNDDGKVKQLRATAAGDALTVTANGVVRQVRADALTSTGWRPPADGARAGVVLDIEDGTDTPVRVDALPPAPVAAGGQVVTAKRFKLTGRGVDAEWWFDPAGRPVRQDSVWDGHRVVLTLTGIRK